jgi:HpiC1 cyclase
MRNGFLLAAALVGCLAAGQPMAARAATLNILNPGFEYGPALTEGIGDDRGPYVGAANNWDVGGFAGSFMPLADGAAYDLGPLGVVGFMNVGGTLGQTLSDVFEADTNYVLSFDIGHRKDLGFAGSVIFYTDSPLTPIASFLLNDPGQDAFGLQFISLLATDIPNGAIGQNISLRFSASQGQVNIDNVQLNAALVPLPSAVFLFASGMGIVAWSSRKRIPGLRAS